MFGKEDKQSSALPLGQVPKIMASGAARPSSLLIVAFEVSYASSQLQMPFINRLKKLLIKPKRLPGCLQFNKEDCNGTDSSSGVQIQCLPWRLIISRSHSS